MTSVKHRDVVDVLLDQHREIIDQFDQVAVASGIRKRDLFQDLVRLLAVHEAAEELIVHPAARGAIAGGEQVVAGRLQEEHDAKIALSALYDLGVDHPQFDMRLAVVADAVVAHASREEQEEFVELRRYVSMERLERMAETVIAVESVAPTRPHPGAGESPVANLIIGPPTAVFDRIRDAIRDWHQH